MDEDPVLCCLPPAAPLCPFPCLPLCRSSSGPLVRGERVDGALVRSQVTAGRGPHLSPLRSATMAVVPRRRLSTCSDGWQLLLALKRGI